jgi:uncharacterized protein YndB with AHSA1/START domain
MTTVTEISTTQIYQVFIKATPEQIWEAITNPEFTQKYFYGSVIDSTFEVGAPYLGLSGDRSQQLVDGEVLEVDPPRRLTTTWRALYDPETAAEPHSRVSWEIDPQDGGFTKLTVVHDQLEESLKTAENVAGGWSYVLSGLKTLLETGEPLAG